MFSRTDGATYVKPYENKHKYGWCTVTYEGAGCGQSSQKRSITDSEGAVWSTELHPTDVVSCYLCSSVSITAELSFKLNMRQYKLILLLKPWTFWSFSFVNHLFSFPDHVCQNEQNKQKMGKCSRRSYQEGLIGTLAEGRVIRAVDWCLTGELRVKLTHVFSWLLRRQRRRQSTGEEVRQREQMCQLTTRGSETREDPGAITLLSWFNIGREPGLKLNLSYSSSIIGLTFNNLKFPTLKLQVWVSNSIYSSWSAPLILTRKGLKGGSTFRASKSSQLMCRKKGWACRISNTNRVLQHEQRAVKHSCSVWEYLNKFPFMQPQLFPMYERVITSLSSGGLWDKDSAC